MSEPWFDPNQYAWIPGTVLGVVGGMLGSLIGIFAPRGKGKNVFVGIMWGLMGVGLVVLVVGVVALLKGQPYGIWYGFLLPGLMLPILMGCLIPVIKNAYRQAELRKAAAQDL